MEEVARATTAKRERGLDSCVASKGVQVVRYYFGGIMDAKRTKTTGAGWYSLEAREFRFLPCLLSNGLFLIVIYTIVVPLLLLYYIEYNFILYPFIQ